MAKPSPNSAAPTRLLVLELWGLGDLALAIPFLRAATSHGQVHVVAKPDHAALITSLAPGVELVPLVAPWTSFTRKYRLWRWPWLSLRNVVRQLRATPADVGVSARPDPRDHVLLALSGARQRVGFGRAGSAVLLTQSLARPSDRHRAAHWQAIADALGWQLPPPTPAISSGRRIVIHTGAAQAVRRWPRARFEAIAVNLKAQGWEVEMIDETVGSLEVLLARLAAGDRFIGNDSGPGHLAALLGKPTFTIFGPQLPELFAPRHPAAAWIDGAACDYKPCFDRCRFAAPHCLLGVEVESVWREIERWLGHTA